MTTQLGNTINPQKPLNETSSMKWMCNKDEINEENNKEQALRSIKR